MNFDSNNACQTTVYDLGCYGGEIKTPTIDRMASDLLNNVLRDKKINETTRKQIPSSRLIRYLLPCQLGWLC